MAIKLNANKEEEIIKTILLETFCPSSEKVVAVKEYLDKNFKKSEIDDFDENGYPIKVKCAYMINNNGQPIKTVLPKELLMILDDKFSKIISDKADKRKFLKQIIIDWFDNAISKEGILSVNMI